MLPSSNAEHQFLVVKLALRLMQLPDLNLLPALDALLREGSVTGAAEEMRVSASAMSRTLGRLRRVVGDPLLVPAGRGLALTPRARELQPQVEAALAEALAALRPPPEVDIAALKREFTIRTNDAVAVALGAALAARVAREAPGVRLRILPEGDEDPADLRDRVDLDISAPAELPADVRSSLLFEDRQVAVVRTGSAHTASGGGTLTLEQFTSLPQVVVSRRGRFRGKVDELLDQLGLARQVLATVPTHSTACFMALESEVLALLPALFADRMAEVMPLTVLEIPLELPPTRLEMAWHLRLDSDPAHCWLRGVLTAIIREGLAAEAV